MRIHKRTYADVPGALEAVEASGTGPVVKAAITFTALTAGGPVRRGSWGDVG